MKLNIFATVFVVSLASEANIKTSWTKGCKGGYLGHPGIKARQCASALRTEYDVRGARSVQYLGVPNGAQYLGFQQTRSRAANVRGALAKGGTAGASGKSCLGPKSDLQYAGASWAQPARAADDQVLELVELARNGTLSGDLSSDYAAVETEKDGVASRLQEIQG